MREDTYKKISLLKDSLENLSKSYWEQINSFPDFVDVFDEVISDFDNAFRFLPALMEEKVVSYNTVKEILKCYNLIELNLSVEKRKTDESFENDDAWNLVRKYATNAFNMINGKSPE